MVEVLGACHRVSDQVDFDLHGLIGVRLINPSRHEVDMVTRQLGPLQHPLSREPDILIRFESHLPTDGLRYVGLHNNGFTDDGFFILRSKKAPATVRIAFEQIGGQCEIVCQRGLHAVPLLLAIVNLTVLKKDCVPLHASAFVHQGHGIVVTGWAKGGKTESLLSFALQGAEYIGDEWIWLQGNGDMMYGVPENIRLWDWHLHYLPHIRRQMKREERWLFNSIQWLDSMQRRLAQGKIGRLAPVKFWRKAMPALRRQLNVTRPPEHIFGRSLGRLSATPEKIFLLMNHDSNDIHISRIEPSEIVQRMIASIEYEQLPFMEHYMAFKFAFPERCNSFIEQASSYQSDILKRALTGKDAYVVYHPYPVNFQDLYKAMQPYCEERNTEQILRDSL